MSCCACGGWYVHPPEVLFSLVFYCPPTRVFGLDGVLAFPMYAFRDFVSPWPPLFDTVSRYERQCWMVRGLSEILPPLVCHCFVPVCFPSYLSNTIFLAFLNAFSWVWLCSSRHFSNPPTVWGLRRGNFSSNCLFLFFLLLSLIKDVRERERG